MTPPRSTEQLPLLPPVEASTKGMTHRNDPETSRLAAERVQPRLTTLQGRVLAILEEGPMTDDELYHAYVAKYGPVAYVTPAKRRGELRDQGRVVDTGQRRFVATTGSKAVVWGLAG